MSAVRLMVDVPDDDYRYLEFLKKRRQIACVEDALRTALFFYKKLNLHEWVPGCYSIGARRILLVPMIAMLDLMHTLSVDDIYLAGRMTAFKWRTLEPMLADVDFKKPENWDIVLNDLELMGWGNFTRVGVEIRIEGCPLPLSYVKGYLETMFKTRFRELKVKVKGLTVLVAVGEEVEV
jgi:hypothetical protein